MREHPVSVLRRLQEVVEQRNRVVISAITYAELRFGAIGKKVSPKHNQIVDEFMSRFDSVLPWGKEAVEESAMVKKDLSDKGLPIGHNDTLIAGHAISEDCILVTNNLSEFERVKTLVVEDWVRH